MKDGKKTVAEKIVYGAIDKVADKMKEDPSKFVKDDKPLEVVEAYVRENTTVLVDPLDILKLIEAMKEKRETLLRELDTQIKVSNATTYVEI